MLRTTLITMGLIGLVGCGAPTPSHSNSETMKPAQVPTNHQGQEAIAQIMIKFKPNYNNGTNPLTAQQLATLSQIAGTPISYVRPMSGNAHVISTTNPLPLDQVEGISKKLSAQPFVEYAEPDRIMRIN